MAKFTNMITGDDGLRRCWWCGNDPQYVQYHDQEWGRPIADDRRLFEKVCLEGFQAGLSWITILRKRDAFRKAFSNFDFRKVANYSPGKVDRLLANAEIVRHRGKIESTINNAKRAIEIVDRQGSLAEFFWQFEPNKARALRSRGDIQATTQESTALSKELKRHGWTFVGPTTCYAFMQAMGMVNDHLRNCHIWSAVDQARRDFKRPE
jgi:DNA-3-methyladenine glycosylase I